MENLLKYYRQYFNQVSGNSVTKIKTIIEEHMDRWALAEESVLIDLLDTTNMTAEDILETLTAIADYEEDNAEFRSAVLAMRLGLEKPRSHQHSKNNSETAMMDEQDSDTHLNSYGALEHLDNASI